MNRTGRWMGGIRVGLALGLLLLSGLAGRAGTLELNFSSLHGTYRADGGEALAFSPAGRLGWTGGMTPPPGSPLHLGVTVFGPTLSTLTYNAFFKADENIQGQALVFDGASNVWVTGQTRATTYPVTANAYQSANSVGLYNWEGFLMKIDPRLPANTNSILYSTYLGGAGVDTLAGVAVDAAGNVYVAGRAQSTFPTTPNAYRTTSAGGYDAVFAKFNSTGGVVFVSLLGGTGTDGAHGIALDNVGNIYIAGSTTSSDFPVKNACQSTFGGNQDLFLIKFDPTGTNILYSTYLGGTGADGSQGSRLALDAAGQVYLCSLTTGSFPTKNAYQAAAAGGWEMVFARMDTTLTGADSLLSASYFGGSGNEVYNGSGSGDMGIAVDGAGSIYLVGSTTSANLPVRGAYQSTLAGDADAFLAKFSADGSRLLYSTYLGGTGEDRARGIAVDAARVAHVTGMTKSSNFPLTPAAFRTTYDATYGEGFISRLVEKFAGTVVSVH